MGRPLTPGEPPPWYLAVAGEVWRILAWALNRETVPLQVAAGLGLFLGTAAYTGGVPLGKALLFGVQVGTVALWPFILWNLWSLARR